MFELLIHGTMTHTLTAIKEPTIAMPTNNNHKTRLLVNTQVKQPKYIISHVSINNIKFYVTNNAHYKLEYNRHIFIFQTHVS